jgi:hypothetical protein
VPVTHSLLTPHLPVPINTMKSALFALQALDH